MLFFRHCSPSRAAAHSLGFTSCFLTPHEVQLSPHIQGRVQVRKYKQVKSAGSVSVISHFSRETSPFKVMVLTLELPVPHQKDGRSLSIRVAVLPLPHPGTQCHSTLRYNKKLPSNKQGQKFKCRFLTSVLSDMPQASVRAPSSFHDSTIGTSSSLILCLRQPEFLVVYGWTHPKRATTALVFHSGIT